MAGAKEEVIVERGMRLMRAVEDRLGGVPETKWVNDAHIRILGVLLEQVELAINEAKERTF